MPLSTGEKLKRKGISLLKKEITNKKHTKLGSVSVVGGESRQKQCCRFLVVVGIILQVVPLFIYAAQA